MLLAAVALGTWVVRQIEEGVVENYGTASALYFESLIPQLPFLQGSSEQIGDLERAELREVFLNGVISDRVVTYKVWNLDGMVVASFDETLVGRTFQVSESLSAAWNGEVSAEFENVNFHALTGTASIELPLIGVYVPIRNVQTGEVVSVIEFYERAEALLADLEDARRQTWSVVSSVFLLSLTGLSGIVHAGSRQIEAQQKNLGDQLLENTDLKNRVTAAAVRSTSQSDRVMQRIGIDLHDGVAQHLALMALRLEGAGLADSEDATIVRSALSDAMTELRSISRGLALPDIEKLDAISIVKRACEDHRKSFGASVDFQVGRNVAVDLGMPSKIGLYRVTQELLANAYKHADASNVSVLLSATKSLVELNVTDDGIGFEPGEQDLRSDGGQGLIGLRDRLLTLDGTIDICSQPSAGTKIKVTLPHNGDLV